ncbi:acyl-CoA:lysophosphatidylglycerol acyltransferase 1-like [Clavelina lepadiformis]|uniref:acyl-CoA:lysophosphatidylglycerol acyltransferase 1-like n=1 Tax=Clavelina lepadiformis TaxID=159417 RepID=UPI00404254AE
MFHVLSKEIGNNPKAFLKSIPRLLLITAQVFVCLIFYLLWYAVLQPLRLVKKDWFWFLEGICYQSLITVVCSWLCGLDNNVLECGEDVTHLIEDNVLIIANHQSPMDIIIIMLCLQGKGNILSNSMWIMSWIFQILPFGMVSKGHGDAFILQGGHAKLVANLLKMDVSELKVKELQKLRKCFLQSYIRLKRKWLILFPEGGFLRNTKPSSQRYANKQGLSPLNNVAYPKVSGIQNAIDVIGVETKDRVREKQDESGGFKWIIDLTIGYKRDSSLLSYFIGHNGPQTVVCYYRVYSAEDIIGNYRNGSKPARDEKISQWLNDRFVEKDQILETFYESGKFPHAENCRVSEPLRWFLLFGVHVWIVASFVLLMFGLHILC